MLCNSYKDNILLEKLNKSKNQNKEVEELLCSLSSKETKDRPFANSKLIILGTITDSKVSPLIKIFKILYNNIKILERLHYEISKYLLKK